MIKFFRRIRQKLLSENKFSKYLVYALGEILLVMIGILLALQVNNMNERRKAKEFERKMLSELQSSLEADVGMLEWAIEENEDRLYSIEVILEHFDQQLLFEDSLATHFSNAITWFNPNINNPAYESLKTYGEHIITNDSIRAQLSIFEYPWLEVLGERNERFHYGTVSPIITGLFDSGEMWGEMRPYNYENLVESREFRHILNTLKSNRNVNIQAYRDWLKTKRELIVLIEKELHKK